MITFVRISSSSSRVKAVAEEDAQVALETEEELEERARLVLVEVGKPFEARRLQEVFARADGPGAAADTIIEFAGAPAMRGPL